MSGDSPNALTSDSIFDFRDGRSSPPATTSKDSVPISTASALVEPTKEEEKPDFSNPSLNQGSEANKNETRDDDKMPKVDNQNEKEEKLLNGSDVADSVVKLAKKEDDERSDVQDDSCIVNCIYYTMECCQCVIL